MAVRAALLAMAVPAAIAELFVGSAMRDCTGPPTECVARRLSFLHSAGRFVLKSGGRARARPGATGRV